MILGSNLARLGDVKSARVMFAVAEAGDDALGRVYGSLALALLELSEGRPREAVTAAARAAKAHAAAHADVQSAGLATLFDVGKSIGWVAAAAALAAGESSVEAKVATPEYFKPSDAGPAGLPTDWFALARADDRTRRLARARMFSPTFAAEDEAVLPAVIYVLREIARDGKDPNLWVDVMLPIHDKQLNGATAMRARAEAARWRGAAAEGKEWDARALRLEGLIKTPQQALLARFAGIY